MSTRAWAMKAESRIERLEAMAKPQPDDMALKMAVADALARLEARIAALEAKAHVHPGRKAQE